MIARFDLKSVSPNLEVLMLSISMWPSTGSIILKMAKASDDFPAPVLPTIPTFSPALMSKLMSFKTKSKFSRYLVE
ncbi:hypothetical protein WICPIJ_001577 [Wickerhamomyces pijperi]|uniref:Uncharacterized protein n=1 Tax=Wickerhamomyces pijperi TaxID=599730 RepID=A0A9P8QAL4_WICPI|nr:hypothetical protein WICPIJ_001577 [Wickerhamomyces pijperi]